MDSTILEEWVVVASSWRRGVLLSAGRIRYECPWLWESFVRRKKSRSDECPPCTYTHTVNWVFSYIRISYINMDASFIIAIRPESMYLFTQMEIHCITFPICVTNMYFDSRIFFTSTFWHQTKKSENQFVSYNETLLTYSFGFYFRLIESHGHLRLIIVTPLWASSS